MERAAQGGTRAVSERESEEVPSERRNNSETESSETGERSEAKTCEKIHLIIKFKLTASVAKLSFMQMRATSDSHSRGDSRARDINVAGVLGRITAMNEGRLILSVV